MHFRPAGADRTGLRRGKAGARRKEARHRGCCDGKWRGGDHHLPHRGRISGQPAPGMGEIRHQRGRRSGPAGFHRQRHGLFPGPGLRRSLRRPRRPETGHPPGGGSSRGPVSGRFPADPPWCPVCRQIRHEGGPGNEESHVLPAASDGCAGPGTGVFRTEPVSGGDGSVPSDGSGAHSGPGDPGAGTLRGFGSKKSPSHP